LENGATIIRVGSRLFTATGTTFGSWGLKTIYSSWVELDNKYVYNS
jgi:hypothetical protein